MARRAEIELRELLRRELVGEGSDETDTSDEESQSYWHMLGLRILENLQVEVTNIHIRFEDKQVGPVFGGSVGDDVQREAGASKTNRTTSAAVQLHSLAIGVTLDCISFRNEDPSKSPLAAADEGGTRPTSSLGLPLATAQSTATTTVTGNSGAVTVGEGTGPGESVVSKLFSVVSFAVYADEGEVDVSRPWDGLKSDSLDGGTTADGESSGGSGADAEQHEGGKSKGKNKGKGKNREKGSEAEHARAAALAALVRRLRRLGPGGRELSYVLKPLSFSAVVLKREIHQSGPSSSPVGVSESSVHAPTPSPSSTHSHPPPRVGASSLHEGSTAPPPAHTPYSPGSAPGKPDGQCPPRWQISCRTEEAEVMLTSSQLRCGLALQRRVMMVRFRRAVILIRPRRRPGLAPRGAWWRFAAEATGAVRPLRMHRGWLGFLYAFRLRRRFIQVQQQALGHAMGLSWVAPLSQHDEDWLEAVTRDRQLPIEVILLWRAVAKVELKAVESKRKAAGLSDDAALDANDPMAAAEVDPSMSSRATAPSASSKLFAKAPRGSTMRRTSVAASSAVKAAGKLKKALRKGGGLSSKSGEAGGKEGKVSQAGVGSKGVENAGGVGDAVAGSGSGGGVASGKGKGKGKGTKGRMWNNVFGKSKPAPLGTGVSDDPETSPREAEDINGTGAAVELSSAELEELQGTVESEMRSLAQLAEMQGTVDWVHLHAELLCVRLRVSDAKGPIALGHITGLEANLTQRGLPGQKKRALALALELGDVMVMDVCTPGTKYPELLRPATAWAPDAVGGRGHGGWMGSGGPIMTPPRPEKRRPTFLLRVGYEPARVLEYEPVAATKALVSSPWSVMAEGRAFEAVLVRCECTRRLYDCFNHTLEEEENGADPFDPGRSSLEERRSFDGFSTPRVQKIGSGHLQTPQHHAQQTIRSAERAASTLTRLAQAQASAVESAVAQHTANHRGAGGDNGGRTSPVPPGSLEVGKSSNGKRTKRKREKPPWRVDFKMQAPFVVSLGNFTA